MGETHAAPGRWAGVEEVRFRDAYVAAVPGGVAILLAFFVWHWFNIAPVWTVLVEGTAGVAVASAAIAWAWTLSRRAGRFAPPWGGSAFGGLFAGGVLLGAAIGRAFGPWPDPTGVRDALPVLAFVLIPGALIVLAGWRLVGSWKGALAYGLASLVLLVYLGGSVVQRGAMELGLGLFRILVPGYLLAGALIGWLEPILGKRAHSR